MSETFVVSLGSLGLVVLFVEFVLRSSNSLLEFLILIISFVDLFFWGYY